MAYYFPEGTKIFYSSTFASPKTISSITNADPAVASATGHGYVDGDPVLISSGWEDANDTVFEVDQLTADTFGIVNLDASDTTWFPAGTGGGTAKKITNWTEIPQTLTISTQGGGPKYGTISPLGARNDKRQIIGFEASSIDLSIGWDPTNATIKAMQAISRKFTKVAFKLVPPGGARIYGFGNMSAAEAPQLSKGNVIALAAGISMDGRIISYGA